MEESEHGDRDKTADPAPFSGGRRSGCLRVFERTRGQLLCRNEAALLGRGKRRHEKVP